MLLFVMHIMNINDYDVAVHCRRGSDQCLVCSPCSRTGNAVARMHVVMQLHIHALSTSKAVAHPKHVHLGKQLQVDCFHSVFTATQLCSLQKSFKQDLETFSLV